MPAQNKADQLELKRRSSLCAVSMILFDQAGAGEHRSRISPPGPALKGFVEHFWVQHAPAPKACQVPWRIVPDMNPHIIVAVSHGKERPESVRCTVVGARSRFADISLANRVLTLGVQLQPGALSLLARLPASDFTDRSVSIAEVLGARGKLLIERLAEQGSVTQTLHVLDQFLGNEFGSRRTSHELDALVTDSDRADDLAAVLGLPSRTLYARMKERVGLAPKHLLRIRRIHRTLKLCRDRRMPWAELSAACGFSDQSHLVREFQDLLGESPSAWQARALTCRFVQDEKQDQGLA
jgi:AraC-like DNA-binding protein